MRSPFARLSASPQTSESGQDVDPKEPSSRRDKLIAIGFLMALSYFTFVHGFWNPQGLFWDENYHIASAQKYLNGVFFMEPHPPLGKLVVALGEGLFHFNAADDQFIGTDYAQNPPEGFSFVGYRLLPVLFAWLTVPIVFGIFLLITGKTLWATLFSFLYVFENSYIVHFRSAMLDSTMFFFAALTLFSFLLLVHWKDDARKFLTASILFGVAFAGIMTTKVFGLILILLFPFLLYALWPDWKRFANFLWAGGLAFLVVFIAVWQVHFSLAEKINPSLPDQGYYQASDQYKALLQNGKNHSLFAFPIMIRDSMNFVGHYEQGVPRLDLCKQDENGSPWFFWPFGGRTINFRWAAAPGGNAYRYLYLVPNPVVWSLGLLGIMLTVFLLVTPYLLPVQEKPQHRFLLLAFFTLYACFLIAVSRIDRVLYLYHYFLPLFFSLLLFAVAFMSLRRIGSFELTEQRKSTILLGIGIVIFLSFQFYRPLSFYEPITDRAFERRSLLDLWDLRCVRCTRNNPLVVPTK